LLIPATSRLGTSPRSGLTLPMFPIWNEATPFESQLIWEFLEREQSCRTQLT
jgi:hypothetical protein